MRCDRLLLIAAVAVWACNAHGGAVPHPAPGSGMPASPEAANGTAEGDAPSEGRKLSLAEGEKVALESGLEVEFVAVLSDSRCPQDVQCIWEGNAEIELELSEPGAEKARVKLNSNPRFATRASYRAYTVELLELHPYPRSESGEPGPYRATLEVEGG